mgnify:CR=1 FL=1
MENELIEVPLYNANLRLFKGEDIEEVWQFYDVPFEAGYDGGVFRHMEDDVLIEFGLFVEKHDNPGIIAHESLHVTNGILDKCGVWPDHKNDEAQAYLLKWVVNQVTEFYNGNDE